MVGSRADAGGQLLRELEALSQALYKAKAGSRREQQTERFHHHHHQGLLTWHSQGFEKTNTSDIPDFLKEQVSHEEHKKKKGGSLWDWKPLRKLAHIGQTRFECEFIAHVHGITKLPSSLEGLRLQVRLKHKDSEAKTVPSLVFKSCADFEESLKIKCSVYGSSSGSGVRYMSKTFTLSVVAPDASELDLGKHRLDLSRILPDEPAKVGVSKNSCWNTSFKLSGRAKGGILTITFGYEMAGGISSSSVTTRGEVNNDKFYHPQPDLTSVNLRSYNSLPSSPIRKKPDGGASPTQSEADASEYAIDIEHLSLDDDDDDEATTMTMSSGLIAPDTPSRPDEEDLKHFSLEQSDETYNDEDEAEFSVIEQGVEEAGQDRKACPDEEQHQLEIRHAQDYKEDNDLENEAEKFLHMLGPSSDSEEAESSLSDYSPRALLLKQFEMEQQVLLKGVAHEEEFAIQGNPEDDLLEFMDAAESELQKATQAMRSKARAKMLEDAEAEALMQEWGLNEKAFQSSPPKPAPEFLNALVISQPPCLAEGLGSMIPTRDGGSLRTMNPMHFRGGRNDGRLVLQVSKPVVVPAEMGSGVLDIFRNLAAVGADNMALQVMETMPLEDITGKNIYQIAMEGQAALEGGNKPRYTLEGGNRYAIEQGSSSSNSSLTASEKAINRKYQRQQRSQGGSHVDDMFMSLEDLAPVAMEKIEELAMQGLKIQSDMAEEDAPYTMESTGGSHGGNYGGSNLLEGGGNGSSSMHMIDYNGGSNSTTSSTDGLMAMSISLEEWMRLDAGVIDEAETNEKTKAILDAHHAAHSDIVLVANADSSGSSSSSSGCMGDTLTLAMLVQLRDPLRNFEPVGAPMMAFVQAERVMVPPKPKMFKRVSVHGNSEKGDDEEDVIKPQFKITGVHMAGVKASETDSKKKVWGTQKQQQSGSRWLLANGMGKTGGSKHPLLKSSTTASSASKSTTKGESLWSISARLGGKSSGSGNVGNVGSSSGKGSGSSGITRNPDVKFASRLSLGSKKKW